MTEQERFSFREQRRAEKDKRRRMHLERHAQQRVNRCQNMEHSNKSWFGIGIILVGVVWLLNVLGTPMPGWIFTWPVLLVVMGLFSGLASRFRNMGSFVLILIGLAFLARNSIWPDIELVKYVWPVLIIFLGIVFLLKRHHWDKKEALFRQQHPEWKSLHDMWHHHHYQADNLNRPPHHGAEGASTAPPFEEKESHARSTDNTSAPSGEDWIDITTLLGGTRRTVISKNFRGGDLTNICGGTVIDLTHADIQGMAVMDVVAVWGGIKVIVPPNWEVRLNVNHLMGGSDDHRRSAGHDPNKVLVFTGTVLMAGIEITSEG